MFLDKIKDTTSKELKSPVCDCVISVPGWFTEVQRRSLIDAAEIAGLNPLRLINDTTASALGYGITKTDLPEDKPRYVAFVDIGHSNYQVAIVAFQKGQLVVKGQAYDRHFGGRNFDQALVDHFAKVFQEKYKIDIKSNKKALFRVQTACERLKKVLSANLQAPINIESVMNDIDVSGMLKRDEFEELVADLLSRVHVPLELAIKDAGLQKEDIEAVEMIGGSTRIPAVKDRIQTFFGKPLSFTLNQDEAIARGCAFACAMISPVFRVRDFAMTDMQPYPIKFTWDPEPSTPDDTELIVFPEQNPIPSTKLLSFYRKSDFSLEAQYADPSKLPGAINPWLGRFTVKKVKPTGKGDACQVKVKKRLNPSGVLQVDSAYMVEEIEKEEEEPMPMETDKNEGDVEAPAETAAPPAKKVKKVQNKIPLEIIAQALGLDLQAKQELREVEAQMAMNDKLVSDTEEAKNAFEEYVYHARNQLDTAWADYILDADKEKFQSALTNGEDWLYSDEGEDATKSTYQNKLGELKAFGDPVNLKYKENEERPRAIKALRETINLYMSQATGGEDRFSHIEDSQKEKVIGRCAEVQKWLEDKAASQSEKKKTDPLVFTSSEIYKKREDLALFSSPIMSRPKPKPKVEVPPPEDKKPADEKKAEPKENGEATPMDAEPTAEPEAKKTDMDVD